MKWVFSIGAILLLAVAVLAWLDDMSRAAKAQAKSASPLGIVVTEVPDDAPKLRTEYRGPLADGWSVNVPYERHWRGGREGGGGFATGPNGERVFVSPRHTVREDELPPSVRAALLKFFEAVQAIEAQPRAGNQFTDSNGYVWVKK
jgi:hypothetical protein